MKISFRLLVFVLCSAMPGLAFAGEPASSRETTAETLGLVTIAFVDIVFLIALFLVSATLRSDSKWSLAGALAEHIDWPANASGGAAPALGAAGLQGGAAAGAPAPGAEPRYESSSSRLIAFIGMLAVVVVFVGMANCVLWHCFVPHEEPLDTTELLKFLAGGSSLFVPYAVNQFRTAFESFGNQPKK